MHGATQRILTRPFSSQLALAALVGVSLGSICVGGSAWVLTVTVLPEWFSLPAPVLWLTGACVALSLASVNFMCWERLLARGMLRQVLECFWSTLQQPAMPLLMLLGFGVWSASSMLIGWSMLTSVALAIAVTLISLRTKAWLTLAWKRWQYQEHQDLRWQNDLKLAYVMLASVVAYSMGHEWFDAWLQGASSLHLTSALLPVWLAVSVVAGVSFWGVSAERASTFIDTSLANQRRVGTSRVARLRWWLGTLSTPSAFLLFVGWLGLPDMGVPVAWWAMLPLALVPVLYIAWNMVDNVVCLAQSARMPLSKQEGDQHWHLHYHGKPVDRLSLIALRLAQQTDEALGAAALPLHVVGEGAVPANGALLAGLGPWVASGVFATHTFNDYVQDKMTCVDGRAQVEPLVDWVPKQLSASLEGRMPTLRGWAIQPLTSERLQAWQHARTQRYCTLALLTLLGATVGVMGVWYWQLPWWGALTLGWSLTMGAGGLLKLLNTVWRSDERKQCFQRFRQACSWSTTRWVFVTAVGAVSGFATGAYGGVEFSSMLKLPLVCVVLMALCGLLIESKFYTHFLMAMFRVEEHHEHQDGEGQGEHHPKEPSPLRDALVQAPLRWYRTVAKQVAVADDAEDGHDHGVKLCSDTVRRLYLVAPPLPRAHQGDADVAEPIVTT